MANINDKNIRNIYFIKEGKILLSNSYKTEGAINGPLSDFENDLEYINSIIKKASVNQKEKLIKEGVSFYLSTNNRDYDNSIIYDLYINEDLVSITYEGEEVSDSLYYAGVKDYKYIYKLLFKCELWYYPYKPTCINEEEYERIDADYVQKGYWQTRNELFARRFENKLQEAIEELSKDPTNTHYANIKKATEEKIKNGFVSWIWQKQKEIKTEYKFYSYVFKSEKNAFAKRIEKIKDAMKNINESISTRNVEEMLKIFNISFKRS